MKHTVNKARKALISACLKNGIQDPAKILFVAKQVASGCTKMQVAGVKAHLLHPGAFKAQ
jgi:hypothetical protein